MSDSTPLTSGEFARAMDALGDRIDALTDQVRITNGRVGSLERTAASEGQKVRNIEREVFRHGSKPKEATPTENTPITRRDLAVFGGAVFVLVELTRWLPAMFAAGKVAP